MKKNIALLSATLLILVLICSCAAETENGGENSISAPNEKAEDDFLDPLSTDPIDTVKAYYKHEEEQDYVLEFEMHSVEIDQAETDRIRPMYRDSDLAHERGWENEVFDENRFVIVRAEYYVKYDSTLVPYSSGEIKKEVWLIQDAETLEWEIVDFGFSTAS